MTFTVTAKGSFSCTFPRSGLRVVLPAPEHVAHNDHLIAVILSNAKDLVFCGGESRSFAALRMTCLKHYPIRAGAMGGAESAELAQPGPGPGPGPGPRPPRRPPIKCCHWLQLKSAYKDGATQVLMSPMAFMQRLK